MAIVKGFTRYLQQYKRGEGVSEESRLIESEFTRAGTYIPKGFSRVYTTYPVTRLEIGF